MSAPTRSSWCERVSPALPFAVMAALAIIGGGALAAAMAHAPSRRLLWTVAYLVLVVGVTQAALGVGQALLATSGTARPMRAAEWVMFNLGSAGVVGGTLWSCGLLVQTGTLLFAVALAMFAYATRRARPGWPIHAYRALLVFIGGSAIVGLILAALRGSS